MQTLGQIAKEAGTTYLRARYIALKLGMKPAQMAGPIGLYTTEDAAKIIRRSDEVDRARAKTAKPAKAHNETRYFRACDLAPWIGIRIARVEQAVRELGIVPTAEFDGEFGYRQELADGVVAYARRLARAAGEPIEPQRSGEVSAEHEGVESLQGIAFTTGKPLHTVAAAAQAISAKPVRWHRDGRELFSAETTQAILDEISKRNQGEVVDQSAAA